MEWLLGAGAGRPESGVSGSAAFDALASEVEVVTGDVLQRAARRVLSGADAVASVVGDLGDWDPRRALDSLRAALPRP